MQSNWKNTLKNMEYTSTASNWESMNALLEGKEKTKPKPFWLWWLGLLAFGLAAHASIIILLPQDRSHSILSTEMEPKIHSRIPATENAEKTPVTSGEIAIENAGIDKKQNTKRSVSVRHGESDHVDKSNPITGAGLATSTEKLETSAITRPVQNSVSQESQESAISLFSSDPKEPNITDFSNDEQLSISLDTAQKSRPIEASLLKFAGISNHVQAPMWTPEKIKIPSPLVNDTLPVSKPAEMPRWGAYFDLENIYDGHNIPNIGDGLPNYFALGLQYRLDNWLSLLFGYYDYLDYRRMGQATFGGIVLQEGEDYDYELADNPKEYIRGLKLGAKLEKGRWFFTGAIGIEQSSLDSEIYFSEYRNKELLREERYKKTYQSSYYWRFESTLGFTVLKNKRFDVGLHLRHSISTNDFVYNLESIDSAIIEFVPPGYWGSHEINQLDYWKSRTDYDDSRDKKYSLSAGVNVCYYFE